MKKYLLLLWLIATSYYLWAQTDTRHFTAAGSHYKELQQYSTKPYSGRSWMDTITYPLSEYGGAIIFLLVKPHYLSDDQVTALSTGLSYPANSSEQVQKELQYMLDLQSTRTTEQIERVTYLGNIGYWPQVNLLPSHPGYEQNLKDLFFEGMEIIGESCNAQNFPLIAHLLQGAMHDMRIMEFTIKYKYLRPRPYHIEPKLDPLAKIKSPSFVSGHTLWAFIQAYIWSEIIPEKREDFLALAEEIRRSREIMGIHYPSDNEAARLIAYKMMELYKRNRKFNSDLKEAVAEWQIKAPEYID